MPVSPQILVTKAMKSGKSSSKKDEESTAKVLAAVADRGIGCKAFGAAARGGLTQPLPRCQGLVLQAQDGAQVPHGGGGDRPALAPPLAGDCHGETSTTSHLPDLLLSGPGDAHLPDLRIPAYEYGCV